MPAFRPHATDPKSNDPGMERACRACYRRTMADERFEESYWTEDSQYRKFDGYAEGLDLTMRWNQGLLRLIERRLPSPCRALDVGCGHGAITHQFHRRGFDVTGVDTAAWMIDQARRHAPHMTERFVIGDATGLPEGQYGLIVCLEVLEHLDDPIAALAHMRTRLASGGKLIATTPNLRPWVPWPDPVKADPTHINVHPPAWWNDALAAAGFTTRKVSTFLTVPVVWKVSSWLARSVPLGAHAGPGILLEARST